MFKTSNQTDTGQKGIALKYRARKSCIEVRLEFHSLITNEILSYVNDEVQYC